MRSALDATVAETGLRRGGPSSCRIVPTWSNSQPSPVADSPDRHLRPRARAAVMRLGGRVPQRVFSKIPSRQLPGVFCHSVIEAALMAGSNARRRRRAPIAAQGRIF